MVFSPNIPAKGDGAWTGKNNIFFSADAHRPAALKMRKTYPTFRRFFGIANRAPRRLKFKNSFLHELERSASPQGDDKAKISKNAGVLCPYLSRIMIDV